MKHYLFILICSSVLFAQAQVDFTADRVCEGNITTLSGTSTLNDTSIKSWDWDLDADGIYDDATGQTVSYTFPRADSFTVGLTIKVKSGDDDTALNMVVVNPTPEVLLEGEDVCQGFKNTLSTQTNIKWGSISQYKWDFNGDNVFDKVTSQSSTDFFYGSPGSYTVKVLAVSDKGCETSDQTSVKVYSQPSADFSAEQNRKAGEEIRFTNESFLDESQLQHYLWYFGDGRSAVTHGDVTHIYDSAGNYQTMLIAVTNQLCRDTAYQSLAVDTGSATGPGGPGGGNGLGWGNAERSQIITPNGDGMNDRLQFQIVRPISQCQLMIFNRWNQPIYQTNEYQNDWEGTRQGNQVEAGAYYYRLDCGDTTIVGNVNILR